VWNGHAVHEALGMGTVSVGEDGRAVGRPRVGEAVVDIVGRQHGEAAVMMVVVVPVDEVGAVMSRILGGTEAFGEAWAVLERLEVSLGEGVVVGDMGARVGLGDAEIGEEQRHRLGGHRGAAIGVDGELSGGDGLSLARSADQLLGERGGLDGGDHPADDVAAEDIEYHVQVEVRPLGRAMELGDVPRPELVGSRGEQLGPGVGGASQLVAPLTDLAFRREDAVHRARGAPVRAIVEKRGDDLCRSAIDEARSMEEVEDVLALLDGESARRGAWATRPVDRVLPPVVAGARDVERVAERRDAEQRRVLIDELHHHFPSGSSSGFASKAATFFWISMSASARSARIVALAS
jgi:hypothetical protein